jgi:hypothetical protein
LRALDDRQLGGRFRLIADVQNSYGLALFVRTTNDSDCGFSLLLIDTTTDCWITPFG